MPEPSRIKDIPENELAPAPMQVSKDLVARGGPLLTLHPVSVSADY